MNSATWAPAERGSAKKQPAAPMTPPPVSFVKMPHPFVGLHECDAIIRHPRRVIATRRTQTTRSPAGTPEQDGALLAPSPITLKVRAGGLLSRRAPSCTGLLVA